MAQCSLRAVTWPHLIWSLRRWSPSLFCLRRDTSCGGKYSIVNHYIHQRAPLRNNSYPKGEGGWSQLTVKEMLKRVGVWFEEIPHCLCLSNRESMRLKESSWSQPEDGKFPVSGSQQVSSVHKHLRSCQKEHHIPHVCEDQAGVKWAVSPVPPSRLRLWGGVQAKRASCHTFILFSHQEKNQPEPLTSPSITSSAAAQIKIAHD